MFHFQYTEYLFSLAAIPLMLVFYFLLVRWKKKVAERIGDASLVRQLTMAFSSRKFNLKVILFLAAFALCAVGLAGLVKPDGTHRVNRKGIDIMVALDVSKSMLAQDIKPSRLERARQLVTKIIDYLPDDKIGLVIFAGRAYLQMPLTVDHAAAKMYLSSASPDDVPTQGTVISQALKMCFAAFNPKEKTYKAIILISDGEDHDDNAIRVAKQLAQQGVMVNAVGIGSPQGAPILDPETNSDKVDSKGNVVITKLNEEELNSIAKNGNGLYQLFTSTNEVSNNLRNKLSGIGQTTISDSSFDNFRQYFQYFLAGALFFLLLEFFISERRKSNRKMPIALFSLLLINPSLLFGQSTKDQIFKGNQAYKKNDFTGAENLYRGALKDDDNNSTANYNLGNALYRKENTDEAVQSYDKSIENSPDNIIKEKAYYNKGVAYQKAKKLAECINAYKNALLLAPQDEDARQNLQRALLEQKQKQAQSQKDQKQQNKNDQKKKDQQNKKQQNQNNAPKPQASKISKQDAEEKLKSLLENEKALQDKLHKIKGAASPDKPEKDW